MLTGCPVAGKQKSRDLIDAFIAGAPRDAEGFVFYGMNHTNRDEWARAREPGQTYFAIDNSYFDVVRNVQYRVTRNRLQHTGYGSSDLGRLSKLGIMPVAMRALPPAPRIALVLPQSDTFFRETVGGDAITWCERASRRFETLDGWRVKIRPWDSNKVQLATTLPQDLATAALLITHSSAGAVEALLKGIPVNVSPYSCCYRFNDRLEDVALDEVLEWAGVLADNQMTIGEFKDGTAWKLLHSGDR